MDRDLESITPIGFELGSRELVVDQEDALVDSVRSQEASRDGKIILPDHTRSGGEFVWVGRSSSPVPPRKALRQRVAGQKIR